MSRSKGTRKHYASDLERLLSFVEIDEDGHWIWTGSKNKKGYGRFWYKGACEEAHRVSYELQVGPIPDGYAIDHVCRVRACINPNSKHIEAVTPEENYRRGLGVMGSKPQERCRSGRHLMAEWRRYYGKDRQAKCFGCIKERMTKARSE